MGRNKKDRHSSSFLRRKDQEDSFLKQLHRARVTDVFVDEGTVNVLFEKLPYSRKVTIPLMGLSVPPKRNETDKNYLRASWGRYIPQQGDILLIGFGTDGTPYALGYHAIFYGGLKQYDETNEARGGIGWGEASGRAALRPGDWDFKSSRNSTLYLGDRAKLASGPHSIIVNKPSGDITTTTLLNIGRFGEYSETREGSARRLVLVTDQDESYIPSARGGTAQEINDVVRFGSLIPGGTEIARRSIGDVIDESTFLPMIGEAGTFVREYENYKDLSGVLSVYEKKIDTGGNQSVDATIATSFGWSTPLASWDISNLSTKIESSTFMELSGLTVSLSADTQMSLDAGTNLDLAANILATLDAALVKLGSGAAQPVPRGTVLSSGILIPVLSAMLGDWSALSSVIGIGSASVAAITAAQFQLANLLSTKVMVE